MLIRLRAPAGEARPGPALSPVLGQHQIRVAEFVTEFNRASAGYAPGTPLGVKVHKLGGTKFALRVAPPGVGLLLRGATRGARLTRGALWGVLCFRWGSPRPAHLRTALGTLRSLGLRVR